MKVFEKLEILEVKEDQNHLLRRKAAKQNNDDAFYITDLGVVVKQYDQWRQLCPTVEPFYAVKCNNDPALLQTLALLGTGFDCASRAEIEQVLDMGVSPDRIIFANPCKMKSHIEFARDNNVAMMTFDDEHEMVKIKDLYPEAKLVLRILPPPTKAQCNLGCKYGILPERAPTLLKKSKELGMNLIGVSFHVGSGCQEADAFTKAISAASVIFKEADKLGMKLELLDIGGGFPGHEQDDVTFAQISKNINTGLAEYFPDELRIIAEPGRYFASAAYTLVANIIGKRDNMYYINDGVYGSFNCLLYDHAVVDIKTLDTRDTSDTEDSSVWGPTCDGLDCVLTSVQLPQLNIGDWVYFTNMGAYTMAAGSTFNGMPRPNTYHIIEKNVMNRLMKNNKGQVENNSEHSEDKEVKNVTSKIKEVDLYGFSDYSGFTSKEFSVQFHNSCNMY